MGIGGPDPQFAHMPLIVNEQRKKLSKRRDDVSLMDYRDRGFLPSAMVNYLALLVWGPPDGQEVRLEPLSLTDGFPDHVRHLRRQLVAGVLRREEAAVRQRGAPAGDVARCARRCGSVVPAASAVGDAYAADPVNRDRLRQLLPEVQTRVETLSEVPGYVDFLFAEPEMDQKAWDKAMTADAPGWLDAVIAAAQDWPWEAEALHERFMALAEDLEANRRKFQAPVRVALTGRSVGPPLFESMVVLGREVVLDRLRAAAPGSARRAEPALRRSTGGRCPGGAGR